MAVFASSVNFRQGVSKASAYVPDWLGLDRHDFVRLDRNEATLPLSSHTVEAVTKYLHDHGMQAYPDEGDLADVIGEYNGVPRSCVLATNGSDQAIDLCLRAFLNPGDTILLVRPEFPVFGHTAAILEAVVREVPYNDDLTFPYERFQEALEKPPSLIVFINPNNPTGTPVNLDFVEQVVRTHQDIPVVVDEAYFEFTGRTVAHLATRYSNLLVLRTFSKAFAMAGLRLGYVVANPLVIEQLAKIRNPFDVNALAVVAARAQLAHLDEVHAYVKEVMAVVKPAVVDFFAQRGITVWPGAANFVLVRPFDCQAVVSELRAAGVLVRPITATPLAGTFRMSMGTRAEMARVLDVLDGLSSLRKAQV